MQLDKLASEAERLIYPKFIGLKRKAKGKLYYDYLVPGGPYEEQWDWDGFFIGVGLAARIPSEGIYLRNWCLNFIINANVDGRVAGCLTDKGFDPRLFQMKPFLAQGIFLAGKFLNDYSWVKKYWHRIKKIVLYRENYFWDTKLGLGFWLNHMESGADNNVALIDYPERSVLAVDLNAYIYSEYLAMSLLAAKVYPGDRLIFINKAKQLKQNIRRFLWDDKDKSFYNLDLNSGEFIRRVTFSNFVPLWIKIASKTQGKQMIYSYLLKKDFLNSPFGFRTLAKNDQDYNNRNIIKPYSNWQGPVWPIANYFYFRSLLNYGFNQAAKKAVAKVVGIVVADIKQSGGMHECYSAEDGKALAAPNFISWNILLLSAINEVRGGKNPFELSEK